MRRIGAYRAWLVYCGADAFAMALAWTVAPIYFVTEIGMSPLELVLAGTALEVAYFLFEVPTGAVADLYSRRVSIVVAQLIMGAGFILTGVVPLVGVILAAQALIGFGWTFKSGAEDAWLMDELGAERTPRAYQHGAQVGRAASLAGIAASVSLALVEFELAIIAGGVAFVALGLVLALVMPEAGFRPAPREQVGRARTVARTARTGARLTRARPILLLIVGITFFGGMWSEGIDRLWEAHFLVDIGVPELAGLDPVVWFGVLNAGSLLLALAVAQPLVRRFEEADRKSMAQMLLGLEAALMVGTVAFALAASFALAVAVYWSVRVVRSLARPVYSSWLNASIDDSSVRATVISITNLGDSVGQWGGGPALGGIGSAFGIPTAIAAGAAALAPALALYGRAIRHHGREPQLALGPG